jgi:uncharacterized protein YjbJ (UPF0337 family)
MAGEKDQIKGRIKETTGVITHNEPLKREGKLDQVADKVKEKTAEAVDKIKNVLTNNRLKRQAK